MYLVKVQPFDTRLDNAIEIMNELLVTFVAYSAITFTDVTYNPELKYNIGWVVLLTISVICVVNFILNLIQVVKKLI